MFSRLPGIIPISYHYAHFRQQSNVSTLMEGHVTRERFICVIIYSTQMECGQMDFVDSGYRSAIPYTISSE